MPIWFILGFVSLYAILESWLRRYLLEKTGHGRMMRLNLIVPQNQEEQSEPNNLHRMIISLLTIAILAVARAGELAVKAAMPQDGKQFAAAPNVPVVARAAPVEKLEDTLRDEALTLADDIFDFLATQEKNCVKWNNMDCKVKTATLFQSLFKKRVRGIIGRLESRGAIDLHSLDGRCGATDDPQWLFNCAGDIRSNAMSMPAYVRRSVSENRSAEEMRIDSRVIKFDTGGMPSLKIGLTNTGDRIMWVLKEGRLYCDGKQIGIANQEQGGLEGHSFGPAESNESAFSDFSMEGSREVRTKWELCKGKLSVKVTTTRGNTFSGNVKNWP